MVRGGIYYYQQRLWQVKHNLITNLHVVAKLQIRNEAESLRPSFLG
jgi:hypothetical protein